MRKLGVALLAALSGLCGTASFGFAEDAPRIDEIHWPGIDSYCTFMRDGHDFVFDDPETWRFVFFTGLPEARLDIMARAFMRIDGRLHELALIDSETDGPSEQRRYRSYGASPYTVDVAAARGEEGHESAAYSGTISVTRDGMTSSVAFQGDCGV